MVASEHLIECKRTDRASYSFKLAEFRKAKFEAIMANKRVVMSVEIQDERLAVLPWEDYLALVEEDE